MITLAHLGMLAVDLDYWLTDRGHLDGTEARELAGPLRFSPLQYVQDPASVRAFVAATAVVAVLFTLGWRTRVMGAAALPGDALDPPPEHPDELRARQPAHDPPLLPDAQPLRRRVLARRPPRREARGTLAEPLIVPWAQRLIQLHMA